MPFKVGDALQAGALDRAGERLRQTEIFTTVAVDVEPRPGGVAVVARLVRKPIVNAVRFRGNHELSDDDLSRVARLREGTVLTDEQQRYAVSRVRERYLAEGFDAATVVLELTTLSPGEVNVTFRIVEGPPLLITSIEIDGTLPVPEEDVRAALRIKPGDRYVRAAQRKAQTAIIRLFRTRNYYEVDVHAKWELGEPHQGKLDFTIDPGPLFKIQFSGNHHFSDKHLLGLMDLQTRPIVTDGTWRELARRARRAYQEAGYYFAQVDLRVDPGPPKVVPL